MLALQSKHLIQECREDVQFLSALTKLAYLQSDISECLVLCLHVHKEYNTITVFVITVLLWKT